MHIDTALAEDTLKFMDVETGMVMPPNLVKRQFVHFSADNIDINNSTLDGKNTFHATQTAAWQRGPAPDDHLQEIRPSMCETLQVSHSMNTLT